MRYDGNNPLDLVDALRGATPAERREFSRRAALLGMSGSAVAALLAACGGTSSAPTNTPAASGTQAAPTKGTIPTVAVNQSTAPAASSAASTSGAAPAASAATGGSPTTSAASASGKKPKRGGTFVTVGHQDVSSLSPDDAGPTVWYVLIY
ncbi:MAG: hypothetical protein LC748_08360, partial [Thermomicrobia bacterium]|nr:hypothetical protein [Thermomicrobia bacterium]